MLTKSGRIGLIGTKASIGSGAYDRRIKDMMPEAFIVKSACPLFVPMVEEGRINDGDLALDAVAREYLAPIVEADVDTLIMGCTHYPLISPTIQRIMGPDVKLVDPGEETARALRERLQTEGLLSGRDAGGTYRYFVTDSADSFAETGSLFLNAEIEGSVEQISLEDF